MYNTWWPGQSARNIGWYTCLGFMERRVSLESSASSGVPSILSSGYLEVPWDGFPMLHFNEVSEIIDKCPQLFHLFRVRVVMAPEKERDGLPVIVLSHGLIGQQHEVPHS